MSNMEKYKQDIINLVSKSFSTEADFFNELKHITTHGLYSIEANYRHSHMADIGPVKDFRICFTSKDSEKTIVELVEETLVENSRSKTGNNLWLLLLASVFDDWTHDDKIQKAIYKTFDKQLLKNTFSKIIARTNEIDWKGNLVINDKTNSISSWDHLFRSLAHFFPSNHVVGVIVFAIQRAKEFGITTELQLPSLLKARILFELTLDDYLSVFTNDSDVDFICGFLFCGHAFHTPQEIIAPDRVSNGIKNYAKLDELIQELFTDYYYDTHLKDENRLKVLNIIAETAGVKLKNNSLELSLGIKDYLLYPRITVLFEKIDESVLHLSTAEVANHITNTFIKTISRKVDFIDDVRDVFGFPYDSLSKTNQEGFAYILHSILNCSDDIFKSLEKSLKSFAMNTTPYFFGRFHSEKFAIKVTTSLYLMMLSVSWLDGDLSSYQNRYETLLSILNRSLLDSYSDRLVSHLKSYKPNLSYPDEMNSFLSMIDVAKKSNKLNSFNLIALPIEKKIPLDWPWQVAHE